MLRAPVDVFTEPDAVEGATTRALHLTPAAVRVEAHALVDAISDLGLVLRWDPEEHADRLHRNLGAEVSDEVEATGPDEWVEALGAERAHLGFDRVHAFRREDAAEQTTVHR